jgi:hypothetical protein
VEDDVRLHLAYLPTVQVDAIVQLLLMFEGDVFETSMQPRQTTVLTGFDVPIIEKPGSEHPARWQYQVAPHHQTEFEHQVKALFDTGIVKRSSSNYSATVLFTSKKDDKLSMVVNYHMINALSQTIRDRFQTPTVGDLIAKTRGSKLFSKINSRVERGRRARGCHPLTLVSCWSFQCDENLLFSNTTLCLCDNVPS